MAYTIAGIDVHKRMLAVVVSDLAADAEDAFARRPFGSTPTQLRRLADWLSERQVDEVVMESTAPYWRPVWAALERHWTPRARAGASPMAGTLHLTQAQSNRAPRGRKRDFADAERLVRRVVAQELILSFVPAPEQRLWRTVTRAKVQLTRNRVQLQNRLEALLEQAHLKLSSLVSDLLGVSARRMLEALADGVTDPEALAALADQRLRATPEQLRDALAASQELSPVYRRLLKMALEELQLLDRQILRLDQEIAERLRPYQDPVQRLAEVPWVGACPGEHESAQVSYGHRSPKGHRQMRRLLNQAANGAVKANGTLFELLYRR